MEFRLLLACLLGAHAGVIAAVSASTSPSFSLFVPCQVSGTEGDPEPCHLE